MAIAAVGDARCSSPDVSGGLPSAELPPEPTLPEGYTLMMLSGRVDFSMVMVARLPRQEGLALGGRAPGFVRAVSAHVHGFVYVRVHAQQKHGVRDVKVVAHVAFRALLIVHSTFIILLAPPILGFMFTLILTSFARVEHFAKFWRRRWFWVPMFIHGIVHIVTHSFDYVGLHANIHGDVLVIAHIHGVVEFVADAHADVLFRPSTGTDVYCMDDFANVCVHVEHVLCMDGSVHGHGCADMCAAVYVTRVADTRTC